MLHSLICEDGAETFFNIEVNEAYHSKIGPLIEAKHKFVEPSSLKELLLQGKKVKILDLFFGLGYNTGVALDFAHKMIQLPQIEITAVENDPKIINKIKELKVPDWYEKWKTILSKLAYNNHIKSENISIKLHLNNIFEIIDKLPKGYFDVIFFDPFSHKRTPEFWENDFLASVFKMLSANGTLTTYSGLKRVDELARNLGYKTENTEPIGRKKPSLLIKAN